VLLPSPAPFRILKKESARTMSIVVRERRCWYTIITLIRQGTLNAPLLCPITKKAKGHDEHTACGGVVLLKLRSFNVGSSAHT